jgi:hypothetical protein
MQKIKRTLYLLIFSFLLFHCNTSEKQNPKSTPTTAKVTESANALKSALTLAATFDSDYMADYAKGDANLFTSPSYDELTDSQLGMKVEGIKIAVNEGRKGSGALHFTKKTKPVIYFKGERNINYNTSDWEGTISLWLKLNPEEDLAPGYTDPFQITDSGYNDAAFWVDFSDVNPRNFRMGVYGDLAVWNPNNIGPEEDPNFQNRLLTAKDQPFSRSKWTHVVLSFSKFNTPEGEANFYVNGKYQGKRSIPEPFTWEYANSKIFLGINFIGMIDEFSIFDKSLNQEQVQELYQLKGGIKSLIF